MSTETLTATQKAASRVTLRAHIPALDGIRGLAILMVLGVHTLMSNPHTGNRFFDFLSMFSGALWTGVDLFFALSGFLITGILYDSLHQEGYFRNFYARRVLRIFPLYYGFLIVLICLTYPLHLHWHGKQYLLLTYTQNLGIWTRDYAGFRPAGFLNLNHFWSLAVEEQFYLVWPLVVFLVRDLRKLIVVALTLSVGALVLRIIMASHGAKPDMIYALTFCRMDALLLGGTLALLLRSSRWPIVERYTVSVFLFLLTCLVCTICYFKGLEYQHSFFLRTYGFSLTALTGTSLIAATLSRTAWARMAFENPAMRFFGKYSYGIYIYHYSVDASLTLPLRYWMRGVFHSKAVAVALTSLIVILITIVVSLISYHAYEQHFLKLKKFFDPKAHPSVDVASSS